MTTPVRTFTVKTRDEIRDDMLRTLRSGLIERGVPNPNVTPKSDEYVRATAIANELVVVESNAVISADAGMPDTAEGADLDRWLDSVRLARRAPAGSVGAVICNATSPSLVATGQQLIDEAGLRFEVTVGGTFSSGNPIQIAASDTGVATNHDAGDSLKWYGAAPPYSAPAVLVATGGLTGGVDQEGDETARARLLARLRNPPAAGNWQQIAEFIESSTPSVEKGFVYPALQGPSTVHGAAAGYASETNKSRAIAGVTVSSVVAPFVVGSVAEHVAVTVTSVTDVPTDVAFGLSLPSATTASTPGPGGGWIDGSPWPVDLTAVDVVAYPPTSSTVFCVEASTAPTPGVSHICWLDWVTWTLYRARVVSSTLVAFGGPASTYRISVDAPFVGLESRSGPHFIFPDAENMPAYVAAALAAFAEMGPGEKTSIPEVLQRAYRHPPPHIAYPYTLGAQQLRRISDAGEEVLATSYLFRSFTTPFVPASVTSPPNILVPRAIGFYPNP